MVEKILAFGPSDTAFYFDAHPLEIAAAQKQNIVLLTDAHVYAAHKGFFSGWKTIVIAAGEVHKQLSTAEHIIQQLLELDAGKNTLLIGIGGGVVTDITGFVAATYMRGIDFAFAPSTLLAMTDAAIGGKNGINVGLYKNMMGTIRQPKWVAYHYDFLQTLPQTEWRNGFAEIIKHACILDLELLETLEQHNIAYYRENKDALSTLIQRNVMLKAGIVQEDEQEKGSRKLLNFGHTLGHAIENYYRLPHGHAVAIGMCFAADLSSEFTAFAEQERIKQLVAQYELPTHHPYDMQAINPLLWSDKKRKNSNLQYILLEQSGKACIQDISKEKWEQLFLK